MYQEIDLDKCRKCRADLTDDFCSKCGCPKTLKRIDASYIRSEMANLLNFDKGLLYTIKELIVRPGNTVQNFIHHDRNRLVKPLLFVIICSLIYTISQQFLKFEDGYVNAGVSGDSVVNNIFEWIKKNYGYANILLAVFIAGWIKLFFRKYNYKLFEIIILLCFVMGVGMLIYSTFGILETLTKLRVLQIGAFIGFIYTSWAIGQFFYKKKLMSYLKALIAYMLGVITFYLIAVIIGLGVDFVIKIY